MSAQYLSRGKMGRAEENTADPQHPRSSRRRWDDVTVSLEMIWPLGQTSGLRFSRQRKQTDSLLLMASVEKGAVFKQEKVTAPSSYR